MERIVTGGQTGVDRAALDVALELGFSTGGFVPLGRIAEDGRIPELYPDLIETSSPEPGQRTRLNVLNSDATLLISRGGLTGGSLYTRKIASENGKPFLHIDLGWDVEEAVPKARAWLGTCRPAILNVAGPRASEDPNIYDAAYRFLHELFQ